MVKISQTNLLRSKLRTFLTILAVFIGTFAISFTTGVGNGVKAYINKELGNVGVENAFVVQAHQTQGNPLGSEVVKYDPNQRTGGDFEGVLLTPKDLDYIRSIKNVLQITPNYRSQIDYISVGGEKYMANASQFIPGLNLDMAAGTVIDMNNPQETTIPIRYISPLGFSKASDALGKTLVIGYRNSKGKELEKSLTIVGVQQESVLGNSSIYIT